ncbi:MAG: hypothetical protein A2079_07750 [Geobacteraceae bacterium GWC2_48_7]|nr:MAG: hypothetical protein A2079_07750 [Geobacteraceae bacterium GWC2_48_7]
MVFEQAAKKALEMAETVRQCIDGAEQLSGAAFDICSGKFRVTGSLNGIWPERLIRYRCAKLSPKDQVRLWIEHLILNLLETASYPKSSRLIMTDAIIDLEPYADSATCLQDLLETYWEGLKAPLHFFPRSTFAYLKSQKISDAERVWNGEQQPESKDPSFSLCFGGTDPFDEEFTVVAEKTFGEYFRHYSKNKF